jgi:hypothetical protein
VTVKIILMDITSHLPLQLGNFEIVINYQEIRSENLCEENGEWAVEVSNLQIPIFPDLDSAVKSILMFLTLLLM